MIGKHYRFVDLITQGYLIVVASLVLVFRDTIGWYWPWLLGAHAVVIMMIHGLIYAYARYPQQSGFVFLRHFYPILLYTGFYRETGLLNHVFFHGYLDVPLLRLEQALFGYQPAMEWMQWFPFLWLSEPLYAAYFSYYVMIVGVGLALFRQHHGQFAHYISLISFMFYVCYLFYIVFPVMGPRLFYCDAEIIALPADLIAPSQVTVPEGIQTGVFYHLMAWIYQHFEAPGAAFPSSHVAIACGTVFFSFRYLRRVRWLHLGAVLLLAVSTVYCRYHYVVDVLAGGAVAALLLPLGNWFYGKNQLVTGNG